MFSVALNVGSTPTASTTLSMVKAALSAAPITEGPHLYGGSMGAELEGALCTDKMWRTVVCSTVQVAYHSDMIPGVRVSPMISLFLCSGGISTRTFPEQRIRHSRDEVLAQKTNGGENIEV